MSGSYRPLIGAFIVALVLSSCALLPARVSADISYYVTCLPSANNATYEYHYGKLHYGPVPSSGIWIANDGYYQDIYTPYAGVLFTLNTDDYTKEDWVDPEIDGYVNYLPPDGSNISAVWVIAAFQLRNPQMTLSYSIDGGDNWNTSGTYGESSYIVNIAWNVTSLETWTPALVNSTDFMVKCSMYPTNMIHYYVDYLGVRVHWDVGEAGGAEDPPDDPESGEGGWDFSYDFIMEDGGIIGVLGLVGFIGLIVIPAGAIAIYRNDHGDGRISLFVKMLVLWVFCLTMVLLTFEGG